MNSHRSQTPQMSGQHRSRRRAISAVAGHATGLAATLSGLQIGAVSADSSEALNPSPLAKAKSVILIFNCGAPSHTDLWDMKPLAPAEIRGEFRPIETSVSGIEISELLPRLATRMKDLSIIRSVHHNHGGHNSGMYWSTVGKPYRIDSTLINPSRADIPCFGTLVSWLAQRDGYTGSVPPYVITPFPHCDSTKYLTPGQFGGCLGSRFDPFVLNADPAAKGFQVPGLRLDKAMDSERLTSRILLLDHMEQRGQKIVTTGIEELHVQRAKALGLISSDQASEVFDLSREPDSIRERYGRHSWGQSHLLARRLVEAGSRFVTTVNGPSITWDTHKDNFNQLKNRLVPPMEQAFTALLDDLTERGLLDQTLVIWMGDFGRTPIINRDAGRDHWPQCYSMVMGGGGIRGGQVIGESDRTGAYPRLRPVRAIAPHWVICDTLGRS
ncbi:MAG: DUF1501 domain-containing protein [Planctomycetia bacterium]